MSHLSQYMNRSARRLRDMTSAILRMSGADDIPRTPKLLYAFNSPEDIARTATGCDGDIGGLSTTHFELDTANTVQGPDGPRPTAKFWGDMRLRVKPGKENVRPGYAGFRNRRLPTLFGDEMQDLSNHEYLGLRVRLGGDPRTKDSYFVNIQTDGPIHTDLWQHRLFFRKTDASWQEVYIPISSFVLTNSGEISERQIAMNREKIRSIGISMLGGNSGIEGRYELGIDQMWAVNPEDVAIQPESK